MTNPIGSICHIELFAHDLKAIAAFYTGLFGWKTNSMDEAYLAWEDAGGMSGGFTTAGAPVTNPAATLYIKGSDIPATLKKIIKAGGVLIKPKTDIGGGHGFYALFRDPAGNNIGLWAA